MLGVDWTDPETLWINLTNLAMGVIVLLAVAGLARALFLDLCDRGKARGKSAPVSEPELIVHSPHRYFEPGLGVTYADGGEPKDTDHGQSKPPFKG